MKAKQEGTLTDGILYQVTFRSEKSGVFGRGGGGGSITENLHALKH